MMLAQTASPSLIPLWIVAGYLGALLMLGVFSARLFRGTSSDYFVASRSIGPFLLLMSVFGTTMTAFALVGSTGKAYEAGIGVYGLMASSSGLIHSLVFLLIGVKLWAIGKRYNYITQIQYFRARFESNAIFSPSGDHSGNELVDVVDVSRWTSVPSSFSMNSSRRRRRYRTARTR